MDCIVLGDARSQKRLSCFHFHFLYNTHPASNTPYTSTVLGLSHWTLISTPEHDSYPQHFPAGTDTCVLVPSRCKVIRGSGWRDRLFCHCAALWERSSKLTALVTIPFRFLVKHFVFTCTAALFPPGIRCNFMGCGQEHI